MNVASCKQLAAFWETHAQAKAPLLAWYALVARANWTSPQDVKAMFNGADFLAGNRVIFDIGGNNYRLVVRISYQYKNLMIKFVGTHREYDGIDPATI